MKPLKSAMTLALVAGLTSGMALAEPQSPTPQPSPSPTPAKTKSKKSDKHSCAGANGCGSSSDDK